MQTPRCPALPCACVCVCAGHVYYFLEDVYPRMSGRRPLQTPAIIKAIFPPDHIEPIAPAMVPPPAAFPMVGDDGHDGGEEERPL